MRLFIISCLLFASALAQTGTYQLEQECTAGTHYGTQFTEAQTPTIGDCLQLCYDDSSCQFFVYGTQSGFESTTGSTSDGYRANDCIFAHSNQFVTGWESNCRWNLYSVHDVATTGCDSHPCLDGDGTASCYAPDTGLVITCDPGSGSEPLSLSDGIIQIATIPINARNIAISIEANIDADIKLSPMGNGRCFAGYGCMLGSAGTATVEGMQIYFSGDDRTNPVTETVTVDHALEPMRLQVASYRVGSGNIVYSWDGIDPCDPNAITSRTCSCSGAYMYEEGYGCKGGCDSGIITPTEMCGNCKCGGINRLAIASDGQTSLSEEDCFTAAYDNGYAYVSYRAEGAGYDSACVYGDTYSSYSACTGASVAITKWKWSIYSLECEVSTCSVALSTSSICSHCKCNGASRKTHTGHTSKEECAHHAFEQGYTFFSWRENRNLCWFGDDTACDGANYISGVNAEWGLYRVECNP